MSTIDIRVGGVSVADHVIYSRATFQSLADGNIGTASVTIDNSDRSFTPNDLHTGLTLELYIDGQREWDGWITGLARTWPFEAEDTTSWGTAPRFWRISGEDRNALFQKRIMYDVSDPTNANGLRDWAEDTSDRRAIRYCLEHYVDLTGDDIDISRGIETVGSPGPYERFTLGYVSAPMAVLFEDCAKMTGAVYYIDPDRILRYVDDNTPNAPFALSDTPGDPVGSKGYREFEAASDFLQAANQALVWGAGRGSDEPVFASYTNGTSRDAHGLWQWGEIYVGAWKQSTVNKRARTYVEGSPSHHRGHGDPFPVVTCVTHEPGLRVGHVVDFYAHTFDYHKALPIRKLSITFPTPNIARYELEMSLRIDTPFGIPDPWPIIDSEDPGERKPRPPGSIDPIPVSASELIDHFDQTNPRLVGSTTEYETVYHGDPATSTDMVITYPCALEPGDFIWLTYTANLGATPMGGLTLLGPGDLGGPDGFYWGLVGASGTDYHQWMTGWHRVADGTEGGTVTFSFSGAPFFNVCLSVFRDVTYIVQGPPNSRIGTQSGSYSGTPVVYAPYVTSSTATAWVVDHTSVAEPYPGLVPYDWDANDGILTIESLITLDMAWATPLTALAQVSFSSVPSTWGSIIANEVDGTTALGVAMQIDFDGSVLMPAWPLNPSVNTAALQEMFHLVGSSSVMMVTPGQDVTAAPWPGGNQWFPPGWPVEPYYYEQFSVSGSALSLYDIGPMIGDGERNIDPTDPDYAIGDLVGPPLDDYPGEFSGFSTQFWSNGLTESDPLTLVVKWRFVGNDWGSVSGKVLHVSLHLCDIPEDLDPMDVTIQYIMFDIGVYGYGIMTDAWYHWLDNTQSCYPYYAYVGNGQEPSWEIGRWYYTKMEVPRHQGVFTNVPLATNLPKARMKTWPCDQPEPMSGTNQHWLEWDTDNASPSEICEYWWTHDSDFIVSTSDEGWDVELPLQWSYNNTFDYVGLLDTTEYWFANRLQLGAIGIDTGERFEVDAVWAVGTGSYQPYGGEHIVGQPRYVEDQEGTGSGRYETGYPYEPGSLVVYYQGTRLRAGIDYVETDPSTGKFTIISDARDLSSGLTVEFERGGSLIVPVTGSDVYRPAPVLQYGWGTALDGMNCTMACSVMALDRHTLGANTVFTGTPRSTPPIHRSYQYDQEGGTDLADVAVAWSNGWGQTLHDVGVTTWQNFVNHLNEGRGAILQGVYAALPASKRFSEFTGGHAIYVNEQLANGNFWGCDPLYRHPVIYTEAQLMDYAAQLPVDGIPIGYGWVSAAYTQVTG